MKFSTIQKNIEHNIVLVSNRRLEEFNKRKKFFELKNTKYNNPLLSKQSPRVPAKPRYWDNAEFDPERVLKNSSYLSRTLAYKFIQNEFDFGKNTVRRIPKANGKFRELQILNIADEAVSLLLFQELSRKNSIKFSNHSYAFRSDASPYDAVNYITQEFSACHRLYVAEFDFENFFNSISHEYILNTVESGNYHITKQEKSIIKAYLALSPYANQCKGIIQGSALSQFLANLSVNELDHKLESLGVSFTRFADDLLVWGKSYHDVNLAVQEMIRWSQKSNVKLNSIKSQGIRIISSINEEFSEFRSVQSVKFLNHEFYLGKTEICQESITKIKKQLNNLIYLYLLKAPLINDQDLERLKKNKGGNAIDRDYISLVFSLRRFLYGSISESKLQYLSRNIENVPRLNLFGIIPFYAGVTESKQLSDLDAWLVNKVKLAMKKRIRLLKTQHCSYFNLPDNIPDIWNQDIKEINELKSSTLRNNKIVDIPLGLPSAARYHFFINKMIKSYGPEVVVFTRNTAVSTNYLPSHHRKKYHE